MDETNEPVQRADVGMAWGIKRSFVSYVTSLGDSSITLGDGAALTRSQEFYFPLDPEHDVVDELRFGGSVAATAHFGALTVEIISPVLRLGADRQRAELWSGQSMSDPYHLADVELGEPVRDGDVLMWLRVPTTLSASATILFGSSYAPGEEMDPVTVRIEADRWEG